jgi:hypothetical protein
MVKRNHKVLCKEAQEVPCFKDGVATDLSLGNMIGLMCCHYNDLQSLMWLVKELHCDPHIKSNGWTMLHLALAQHHAAIAVWLVKSCDASLTESGLGGLFGSHIAASAGFPKLAIHFERLGCPELDTHGRNIYWHLRSTGVEELVTIANTSDESNTNRTAAKILYQFLFQEPSIPNAQKIFTLRNRPAFRTFFTEAADDNNSTLSTVFDLEANEERVLPDNNSDFGNVLDHIVNFGNVEFAVWVQTQF